jgi:hypothetical protein
MPNVGECGGRVVVLPASGSSFGSVRRVAAPNPAPPPCPAPHPCVRAPLYRFFDNLGSLSPTHVQLSAKVSEECESWLVKCGIVIVDGVR